MALNKEPTQQILQDLAREIKALRTEMEQLRQQLMSPSIPIMDSTNLPPNAVEGQIVIAP